MKPTLLVLAAGMGSRYGGLKQIDPVGLNDETILEFSVYDAIKAGFGKVVFIIRRSIEQPFKEKIGITFENIIPVEYVFQESSSPIAGLPTIPEREKPWGTGHAVLVAARALCRAGAARPPPDAVGAVAKNAELALKRAKAVERELTARGIAVMAVESYGEMLPVANNDTESGRERNRRVEVWVI